MCLFGGKARIGISHLSHSREVVSRPVETAGAKRRPVRIPANLRVIASAETSSNETPRLGDARHQHAALS
eukprot:5016660-Amphidinium_carterae.1